MRTMWWSIQLASGRYLIAQVCFAKNTAVQAKWVASRPYNCSAAWVMAEIEVERNTGT